MLIALQGYNIYKYLGVTNTLPDCLQLSEIGSHVGFNRSMAHSFCCDLSVVTLHDKYKLAIQDAAIHYGFHAYVYMCVRAFRCLQIYYLALSTMIL